MAREKGMACRRLYVELAKRSPVKLTAAEVVEFLRVMSEVIAEHVAPQNVIRIPQLATFRKGVPCICETYHTCSQGHGCARIAESCAQQAG